MQKIKVLHIIKSLGRGGAEMLLPETLKLHDTSRFEFHYIYFLSWKDQMVESIKATGGKVKCFSSSNNFKLLGQFPKVIDYCKEEDIDIIHCHLPWAGFLGRLVFLKTNIPTIYTEHNMQDRYHWVTKMLNKATYNFQSLALGVSEDVTESINNTIGPKIRVDTLLNGVNTDSFQREPLEGMEIRRVYGIPKNAIVIGNVAVFRFQKRLVEWLRAFKKVEAGNPAVYGILVGFGPLEKEVFEEVERLGLKEKVFFPGLQVNVKPYFSAMDIFMMSSSFEGLPIALLEAMSMECAVVTTNAGGVKEVIRHDKDGLICEVANWKELSELCQILIRDPEKLRHLKYAARQRVVLTFSLKKMVVALESIYEDILIKKTTA